jgi:hypothetical protein
MHQIYSTLAADFARDRIREADRARLADGARQRRAGGERRSRARTGFVGHLRIRLAELLRQPSLRPTPTPDSWDCG